MRLTDVERDVCEDTPDILDALAEWHETQADMSASMGVEESVKYHDGRAAELRCEAEGIRLSWED